ncbi:MAG: hypothetical protein HDR09_18330 [Lachnospiraceae bacterium]|nr:hypothetical protein [Lachnospiraceae bacterium]
MPVAILTDIHPVEFFGDPECECKTSKEGGGYQDTATLRFLTGAKLPRSATLGIVVTDVNGNSFLLGSKEHPLPVIEPTRRFGTPSSDSAGLLYEITHVAIKSMVPCNI